MVTVAELQTEVEARFDRLAQPAWPDPHPDRDPPDEEYSRVTEPERYRVVQVRGRVWAEVLHDLLGARVEPVTAAELRAEGVPSHISAAVRLVSQRSGTLPLVLLESGGGASMPADARPVVLAVAVVRPDLVVESQPDCGCDACDSGSADLLEAVDAAVRHVVGGPFVVLRGPGWSAYWHPSGGSATRSGRGPAFDSVMDLCRRLAAGERVRLPPGTEAYVGRSWVG